MSARPSFLTLLLLISFASVNAVLFTPALPSIIQFFGVSEDAGQQTITWFMMGYAIGQLVYGPLASRFGHKPALYAGISLQILCSLLCIMAGVIHLFWLLITARFLLALGAGVGLKMTFTLVNEYYPPKVASRKISHLMLAFAVTPGLGVALGGMLNAAFGWTSCFLAGAGYGLAMLFLVRRFPESSVGVNRSALKVRQVVKSFAGQFTNKSLVMGGLLMGSATCFIYLFAAFAPFIAITLQGMSSSEYGFANLLPSLGLIIGSLSSAHLSQKYSLPVLVAAGTAIACVGAASMAVAMIMHLPPLLSLFLPMIIICAGSCIVLASASSFAMSHTEDKSHGSAVMNFLNMGLATLVVLSASLLPMRSITLPVIDLMVGAVMCLAVLSMYRSSKPAIQ